MNTALGSTLGFQSQPSQNKKAINILRLLYILLTADIYKQGEIQQEHYRIPEEFLD